MTAPIEQIARDAELLPCPFCGGHAILRLNSGEKTGITSGDHFVECEKCGIQGNKFEAVSLQCIDTRKRDTKLDDQQINKAFDAWNTRQACGQQPVVGYASLLDRLKVAVWMVGNIDTVHDKARWWKDHGALWEEISEDACNLASAPTPPVQQSIPDVIKNANACVAELNRSPGEEPDWDYMAQQLSNAMGVCWPGVDLPRAVDVYKKSIKSVYRHGRNSVLQQPAPTGWRDISTGWRDISSAPKDIDVLLWWPYWSIHPCVGHWDHRGQRWWSSIAASIEGPQPEFYLDLPAAPHPVRGGEQ